MTGILMSANISGLGVGTEIPHIYLEPVQRRHVTPLGDYPTLLRETLETFDTCQPTSVVNQMEWLEWCMDASERNSETRELGTKNGEVSTTQLTRHRKTESIYSRYGAKVDLEINEESGIKSCFALEA